MKQDKRRALTPAEIRRARRLRASYNLEWTAVARRMKCSYELIRRALDPEYAELRNRTRAETRAREYNGSPRRRDVPPEVLADRDHRSELPRSITAFVCGDPAPGYSALDQKNGHMMKANTEMIEGFRDGYDLNAPEPSANRSASYRHGFANGRDDVLHKRPRDTYENICAQAEAAMAADANR